METIEIPKKKYEDMIREIEEVRKEKARIDFI
jgi:hypothetical protein